MTRKLIISIIALACISVSIFAQKAKGKAKKAVVEVSAAEKMGYERTNKYWGPGTYYSYAPGTPQVKMVNNQITAMRDLTGISREDCITELGKQGFVAVAPKEIEKWYGKPKDKSITYYYSPDKSYILLPQFKDLEKSAKPDFTPYAATGITCFVLRPKEDSAKVVEMAWQYMRDLYNLKILMSSFGSTFKKADPKAYPSEVSGSTGWNSMRAGTFLLRKVDGKLVGTWTRNEEIVRRTMGNTDFELKILGTEPDFAYQMHIKLEKEGYVIRYDVVALTLNTLEPGDNWTNKHKLDMEAFNGGLKMDKEAIALYKKAPLPPVLEDINKLLHIQK